MFATPIAGGVATEIVSNLWFRRRAENQIANKTADAMAISDSVGRLFGKKSSTEVSAQLGVDTYLSEHARSGLIGALTHAGATILATIGAASEFLNSEPIVGYALTCLAISYLFGTVINTAHWLDFRGTQSVREIR